MPIYGEGECHYGLLEVCRLGDKGIEVHPIYCLNCVLLRLGDIIEEAVGSIQTFPKEEDEPTERELH